MPHLHPRQDPLVSVTVPVATAKTDTNQARSTEPASAPQQTADQLNLNATKSSAQPSPSIKLFETDETGPEKKGWQVKTVHLNYGYVLDNQVLHTGPMRIQNSELGTDVSISGAQQVDRKNWEYLKIQKGQRFAPDEPQFNVGVNLGFANGFGVEVDAKHNKIIMDGYDQNVEFDGQINGAEVHHTAPLNSFMQQHEQTLGNLQLSALGTYSFDLPAPGRHRFSLISKAGPSLITSNTRSQFKGPNGEFSGGTSKLQVVGYGVTLENGLRYQFGPKLAQLGLELTHGLSYLNYAGYDMVNGYSGSHDALYSSFALKATIGLHGNKKP